MRQPFLIALLICCASFAGLSPSSAGEAAGGAVAFATAEGPPLAATPQARALVAKADAAGAVSIIVGLDPHAGAEAAAISRVQSAFTARLRGGAAVKRFATMPSLALTVTAPELRRLLVDPAVAHVYEDISLAPVLSESTVIIKAKALWTHGAVGTGQFVAILDTGVDASHPMLAGKIRSEACYSTTRTGGNSPTRSFCPGGVPEATEIGSGDNCPETIPKCEHGTLVASIAAGALEGTEFHGVAPGARIIAIQVASKHLRGGCAPEPVPCAAFVLSDVIKGLERVWALRNRFNIAAVNLSLASGLFAAACDDHSPETTEIVEKLRRAQIATIARTGNKGEDGEIGFPACVSDTIAVGATDKTDVLWSDSNHSVRVKLLAPGVLIKAAVPEGTTNCPLEGNRFCVESGTSLAAAHVTGAWALLKIPPPALPNATLPNILAALNCAGESIPGRNPLVIPRRRIDVLRAFNLLSAPAGSENFQFNSGAEVRRWQKNLGEWTRLGGNLAANTATWGSSDWAVASLPYCSAEFVVTARTRLGNPQDFNSYPVETGLLLASHITKDPNTNVVRVDGYLFYIADPSGPFGDGEIVVKRLSNRIAGAFQAGDHEVEVTGCSKASPALDMEEQHELRVVINEDGHYFFRLDGIQHCDFVERIFPPPARIALVARRYGPGEYNFLVDSVVVRPWRD